MGRMDGKVALITGAARGQGRSHALRLAEEGADIIALDICDQIDTIHYPMATPDDMKETIKLVEDLDRRIVARQADCRSSEQLDAVVAEGLSEFGKIDAVVVNHGIAGAGCTWELTDKEWQDMIDVNLTGVWRTIKACLPSMIERGEGGSIIITSSIAGIQAFGGLGHYSATKFGVVGLAGSLVNELSGPHRIRVNTVHPTTVNTDMIHNDMFYGLLGGSKEAMSQAMLSMNALPVDAVESIDISNAVLFLASDESRYVTGMRLAVDAGFVTRVG